MSYGSDLVAGWRLQARVLRVVADQQERYERALCDAAAQRLADRTRIESISPPLAHQVWGQSLNRKETA